MTTDDIHQIATHMAHAAGLQVERRKDVQDCYFAYIGTGHPNLPKVPVFFLSTVTPASAQRRLVRGIEAMQRMAAAV